MADEKPQVVVHKGADIKAPNVKMIFVKPVEGRRVRDPLIPTRVLPPEGDMKHDNAFWRLRIAQGDVVIATAPEETPAPKASKAAKE